MVIHTKNTIQLLTWDEVFTEENPKCCDEGAESHHEPDEEPDASATDTHASRRVRVTTYLQMNKT